MDLTQYNFPQDLKNMSAEDLDLLTYSIRDFLIEKVSKTGGHLASNLGVVEITVALHKVFNAPKDKIIWDVGHQSYVHKILTGRAGNFDTLRQYGGMSGFPKGCESVYDTFDTGHSSTSLSVAAGMASARDIKGDKFDVVAVIGDGSMTGGMAYEALNNIGASKSNIIVILNDNGMSISQNIGGMSQHLSKLRASNSYLTAKKKIKKTIKSIPFVGKDLSINIGHAKDRLKYALMSGGVIFEELGFTYLGPIDGHNLKDLMEVMNLAKHIRGPVIIHTITRKGKGYRNAEKDPNKFHGIAPFDSETGAVNSPSGITYSKIAGDTLLSLGESDESIVAITAAMCDATGLGRFARKYPKRFFDVGIAEAHGVTFAAGLAKEGMHPVVAIYSSFLQRAFDQIIEDVCLQNLPVVFLIDRAGIVGNDGETHHGVFDLSYLTLMPNMKVLMPKDGNELEAMIKYAMTVNGPVAIRYPRGTCMYRMNMRQGYLGKNQRVHYGSDVDIWACGSMVDVACEVRTKLAEKSIDCGVVGVSTVKPMDLSPLNNRQVPVVTIEDNVLSGGFGEKFSSVSGCNRVLTLGWPDKFIEHGSCEKLYRKYGLDRDSIVERICEYIEGKA